MYVLLIKVILHISINKVFICVLSFLYTSVLYTEVFKESILVFIKVMGRACVIYISLSHFYQGVSDLKVICIWCAY